MIINFMTHLYHCLRLKTKFSSYTQHNPAPGVIAKSVKRLILSNKWEIPIYMCFEQKWPGKFALPSKKGYTLYRRTKRYTRASTKNQYCGVLNHTKIITL